VHQESCGNDAGTGDTLAAGVATLTTPQLTLRASLAEYHQSKEHLEKAAKLVAETGYHRRDRELAELHSLLYSPR